MSAFSFAEAVVVVMEADTTGVWLMPVEVVVVTVEGLDEIGVEALIIMERGAEESEVIATMGFWAVACCCTEVGIVETRIWEGCCCWLEVWS